MSNESNNLAKKESCDLRQAQAAAALVNQAWFPANQNALLHIQEGFREGRYEHDSSALIEDLKNDASIFLYTLRELHGLLKLDEYENFDLKELIEKSGLEKVRRILAVSELGISHHNLGDMSPAQANCMAEALRSACITETLAQESQINRDLAFSAALLRQLGLTLISWNYPHLYKRVLSATSSPDERDQMLTRLLGFSPAVLAITIVRQWGLSSDLRYAMGDQYDLKGEPAGELTLDRMAKRLERICMVGESLARVSQGAVYAEPRNDWFRARNEVLKVLGIQGFAQIEKRIETVMRHYIDLMPEYFSQSSTREIAKYNDAADAQILSGNSYIKYLPAEIQADMQVLYSLINPNSVSKNSLDLLVSGIIPRLGFKRGCIYLFDPSLRALVPRLALGESSLTQYQSYSPGFLTMMDSPLATAYRLSTPVIEEEETDEGKKIRFIAGVLGPIQKAGVVYLEPSPSLAGNENALTYFKAIRSALTDCLALA